MIESKAHRSSRQHATTHQEAPSTPTGSELTDVQRARDFETTARRAGKSVEAVYYEGGRHNDLFASPTQHEDEVRRMADFLARRLHA